jgi:hypothetical protein
MHFCMRLRRMNDFLWLHMKNKKSLMHLECNEKLFCLFYCTTQCSITASLLTLITHHTCCFHLQARSLLTSVINYKAVAQIMEKTCNVLCKKQGRQLQYLHLSMLSSKSSSLLWTENIKDITQWMNQHSYTMCMLLNLLSFQGTKNIIPHVATFVLCITL